VPSASVGDTIDHPRSCFYEDVRRAINQTIVSSSAADHFALDLAPNAQPWTGTIYFDDIKITGL
jgi:hypothetical protein